MHQFFSELFSISVAIFSISYCILMILCYFLAYYFIQKIYQGESLGKVSFEFVSLTQFISWIPFGFGLLDLNAAYLFLLPMVREIFDVILIFSVDKKSFSSKYQKFIFIHHINSTITRIILLFVGIFLFNDGLIPFLKVRLLYYCCSFFLVFPGATEKLLFRNQKSMCLFNFKLTNFVFARISHLFVLIMGIVVIFKFLPTSQAVLFSVLTTSLVGINEYFSISSGFSILRNRKFGIQENTNSN